MENVHTYVRADVGSKGTTVGRNRAGWMQVGQRRRQESGESGMRVVVYRNGPASGEGSKRRPARLISASFAIAHVCWVSAGHEPT